MVFKEPLEGDMDLLELLDQEEVWYARQGGAVTVLRLDEMGRQHLENVRGWLLARSVQVHSAYLNSLWSAYSHVNGEQAEYELIGEIGRLDGESPLQWMSGQPLMVAIDRRLDGLAGNGGDRQ